MKHFKSTDEFEQELRDFLGEEDFEKAKNNAVTECSCLLDHPENVWTDLLQLLIDKEDEVFFFGEAFLWSATSDGFDYWRDKSEQWTQRLNFTE